MDNARYNYYKELHPEWSDEQIWTAISIDMQTKVTVENGGNNVDPNTPEIIDIILKKAQDWLEEVLPAVFEKVKQFFQRALETISEWAVRGWEYLKDLINSETFFG